MRLREVYDALYREGKILAEGDMYDLNQGIRENWRDAGELTSSAKALLEERANSLMHSLLWQETEQLGLHGFLDGYKRIANNALRISGK